MLKLRTRIVFVIVAIALAASGGYAGYFHDRSIKAVYASLNPQIFQLKNDVNRLSAQISRLNAQISRLNYTLSAVQQRNSNLQAASMGGAFTFTGGGCSPECNATVRGSYVNYGTQNARNVVVTLTWSHSGLFVQSNKINVGVVAGRSIVLYPDTSYELAFQADHLAWSFSFTT